MKKLLGVIIPVIVILISALLVLNFTVLKEKNVNKESQTIPVGSKMTQQIKSNIHVVLKKGMERFQTILFTS